MSSEDHGPKVGCKTYECGVPNDAHNCPFTLDEKPKLSSRFESSLFGDAEVIEPVVRVQCGHHMFRPVSNYLDPRMYCTQCLTIFVPTGSKVAPGESDACA